MGVSRWLVLPTLVYALSGGAVAGAQTPPRAETAPSGITLPDALSQAAARAPDALVAIARQAAAETEIDVAGMLVNPTVRIGALTAPARFQGGITFTLPLFGQRGAAIRAAEAGADAARWDLARARLD